MQREAERNRREAPQTRAVTHQHRYHHRLVWSGDGALQAEIDNNLWLLPSSIALWIPARTRYSITQIGSAQSTGICLSAKQCGPTPATPRLMIIDELAQNLIQYMRTAISDAEHRAAQQVLLNVLRPAEKNAVRLPMPQDPRARWVAGQLLSNPSDNRSLDQLALAARSSSRTVLRLFSSETGLTFQQWRKLARIQGSMTALAAGLPVSTVAHHVGYSTTSAFVAAFRSTTGYTPTTFLEHKQ